MNSKILAKIACFHPSLARGLNIFAGVFFICIADFLLQSIETQQFSIAGLKTALFYASIAGIYAVIDKKYRRSIINNKKGNGN